MYSAQTISENMYTLVTSAVESERNSANELLTRFQDSPEAWSICRELISANGVEVCVFLSSQILYKKTLSEWSRLTEGQQRELIDYYLGVVALPISQAAFRKLCQCLSMVGVLSMNSIWENFIESILSLSKIEIILEILDCVPFCLEEISLSVKYVQMIQSRIQEKAPLIVMAFDSILDNHSCYQQVFQVIKDWGTTTLPILSNTSFYLKVKNALRSDLCGAVCESLKYTLKTAPYVDLVNVKGLSSEIDYLAEISDRENFTDLISTLAGIIDQNTAKAAADLVSLLCAHYTFLLFYTDNMHDLWKVVLTTIEHPSRTVVFNVCDFLFDLKDILCRDSVRFSNSDFFAYLLKVTEGLATHCVYSSQQHFLDSMAAIEDEEEEMSFQNFRSCVEEYFQCIFNIFESHHPHQGKAFLMHISQLLASQEECKSEIFIYIIRSIVLIITENENFGVLREVIYK